MKRMFRTMMMAALLTVAIFGGGLATAWSQTGPTGGGGISANTSVEADKVHLIVTGYTKVNGEDIGPDCRADLTAVQAMFSSTFQGSWRNRLEIHPLYGDAWTADKIRQYLQDMPLGTNDVVVFYHAGHGSIQDPSRPVDTHSLLVNQGILRRGEVKRLLLGRNCRGVIILTDCCSSMPQFGNDRSMSASPEPRLNRETVRNLFLRLRGMVDITAAEVGTNAGNTQMDNFAGARGAFTVAFLKVASETHVYTHWQDFFPALRQMTQTSSGGRHQAQAFTIREETGDAAQVMPAVPGPSLPTTGPAQ
jgi:Caspase domain